MPERGPDLTKLFKVHVPTLENPLPKMGGGLLGSGPSEIYGEMAARLPEFVLPLKIGFVGAAATFGELVGRQFTDTAGKADPGKAGDPRTPEGYYGGAFLWSIPALALGNAFTKFVLPEGSPDILKAALLGTLANGALSLALALTHAKFETVPFLVREALLVPLSLLIVKGPPAQEAP